jgi:hypothetical protein
MRPGEFDEDNWKKGQGENKVGLVRERFFTPRMRFKNLGELNAWLLDKCIAYAKAHRRPESFTALMLKRVEHHKDNPCGARSAALPGA